MVFIRDKVNVGAEMNVGAERNERNVSASAPVLSVNSEGSLQGGSRHGVSRCDGVQIHENTFAPNGLGQTAQERGIPDELGGHQAPEEFN